MKKHNPIVSAEAENPKNWTLRTEKVGRNDELEELLDSTESELAILRQRCEERSKKRALRLSHETGLFRTDTPIAVTPPSSQCQSLSERGFSENRSRTREIQRSKIPDFFATETGMDNDSTSSSPTAERENYLDVDIQLNEEGLLMPIEPTRTAGRGEQEGLLFTGKNLPKDCYFDDGKRLIDMVICYQHSGKNRKRNVAYRQKFIEALESIGLEVEISMSYCTPPIGFIKLHAPYDFLATKAEEIGIRMPIANADVQKSRFLPSRFRRYCLSCLNQKSRCLQLPEEKRRPFPDYHCMEFEKDLAPCFLGSSDRDTFFSTTQRMQLVDHALERLSLPRYHSQEFHDVEANSGKKSLIGYYWLKEHGVVMEEFPLHDCDEDDVTVRELPASEQPLRRYLIDNWGGYQNLLRHQPLDQVREYFGPKLAMYFAWLGFYTKWLIIPASLGK